MMVAAVDPASQPRIQLGCQLPFGRRGIKVNRSIAAPANLPPRWPLLPEEYVTSRLRELIQQLGEAIHESVIESEQIAGVVQDIRKHGFDVLLMLEATIGLNEVSKETEEADAAAEAAGGTFTKNDVNFLRSLRISVEGEEADESESKPE